MLERRGDVVSRMAESSQLDDGEGDPVGEQGRLFIQPEEGRRRDEAKQNRGFETVGCSVRQCFDVAILRSLLVHVLLPWYEHR
jgi:hypothetical protein